MKIYFASSPRAVKAYKKEFNEIYKIILDLGHTHTSDLMVKVNPRDFYNSSEENKEYIYDETIKKMKAADIFISEVSKHSLAMGFLVDMAMTLDKPIILLHLPEKEPFFFSGIKKENLQIIEYTLETLTEKLECALEYCSNKTQVRFNLMLSPDLNNFLEETAREEAIPKSILIRRLLSEYKKDRKS
jgi:hypothetical protein